MFDHILFDKSGFDNERDPFNGARIVSFGDVDTDAVVYIPIPDLELTSNNTIDIIPLFYVPLGAEIDNTGGIDAHNFYLEMELTARIGGMGEILLSAIGDLTVSILELDEIELGYLETVTIDSDLMVILFGNEQDVSSMTLESEFFDLGVGHNQLVFYYEFQEGEGAVPLGAGDLDVTVIWENRWL